MFFCCCLIKTHSSTKKHSYNSVVRLMSCVSYIVFRYSKFVCRLSNRRLPFRVLPIFPMKMLVLWLKVPIMPTTFCNCHWNIMKLIVLFFEFCRTFYELNICGPFPGRMYPVDVAVHEACSRTLKVIESTEFEFWVVWGTKLQTNKRKFAFKSRCKTSSSIHSKCVLIKIFVCFVCFNLVYPHFNTAEITLVLFTNVRISFFKYKSAMQRWKCF